MLNRLVTFTAWSMLAYIAYATISPIQHRPTLPAPTSFEHLAAFAVLGALFCLAYPRQMFLACVIVLSGAVLLEFAQLLTPDRHGRVQDAVEKIAGGAVGLAIGRTLLYFEQTKRWFLS